MAYNCEMLFKSDCGEYANKVITWVAGSSQINYFTSYQHIRYPDPESGATKYINASTVVYFKEVAIS